MTSVVVRMRKMHVENRMRVLRIFVSILQERRESIRKIKVTSP